MNKKILLTSVLTAVVISSPVLACETFTCPTGTYTVNYITNNNYYGNYYESVVYDYDYEYNDYDYEYNEYNYDYDCDYYDYDYNYDYIVDYSVSAYEEAADDYDECFYNYDECGYGYDVSLNSGCVSSAYEDDYCYESEYYEDYNYGYSGGSSATVMCHWANLRDAEGNIITSVQGGSQVQIIGQCADNPSRTLIYDACSGCYGTVASVYLYGGTDYEYENPTEWSGNYCYEENSSAVVYGEADTWAADDRNWLEQNCDEYVECDYTDYSECAYDYTYNYYNNYGCYDYEDDDDEYYCTDASGSYWYDDCDYEEDEEDCGLTWGECRTITNNYWVDVDISSNTVNFVNNGTIIFVGSYKDIKNLNELECGEYSCDDVKFKKKFCGQIEDYTCDDWCVKVHE